MDRYRIINPKVWYIHNDVGMAFGLVTGMDDFFEITIFVSNGHGPLRAWDWAIVVIAAVVSLFVVFLLLGNTSISLVIRASICYSIGRQVNAVARGRRQPS